MALNLDDLPFDELHEECGVFGIYGSDDAAAHTALGLHALQHRGQEAAGIVTLDSGIFHNHHDIGHVGDIFNSSNVMAKLTGNIAIGHVRYSTAGKKDSKSAEPIYAELDSGGIALAHNGNLTNAETLKKDLIKNGSIFNSFMDTEVILHLIAKSQISNVSDRIIDALKSVKGAFSVVAVTDRALLQLETLMGLDLFH